MEKTWSARALAMLMELQFFWQKSIREKPELLITFFDSVLFQCFFFLFRGHLPPTSQLHHVLGAKATFELQRPQSLTPLIMAAANLHMLDLDCHSDQ